MTTEALKPGCRRLPAHWIGRENAFSRLSAIYEIGEVDPGKSARHGSSRELMHSDAGQKLW